MATTYGMSFRQNHGITGQFRLEGISRSLQFKLSLKAGSAIGSGQVSQGFFHLGFGNLQEWKLHNLSAQLTPMLNYLQGKKASLYNQYERPWFQLTPTVHCSPAMHHDEERGSFFLMISS